MSQGVGNIVAMTTIDELFTAFPGSTLTEGRLSFTVGSSEDHQRAGHLPDSAFIELFYRGEFTHAFETYFSYVRDEPYNLTSISFHLPPCSVVRSHQTVARTKYLLRGLDWWAMVSLADSHVSASFGAFTYDQARELGTRFRAGLETNGPKRAITNFEIWSGDEFPTTRTFPDSPWSNIRNNYTSTTRAGLDQLAALTRNDTLSNGRIILFHGPPGSGKTWAIRSLLTTWKEWTRSAVVVDPDRMLQQSGYFMNMVTFTDEDATRLIVIEDADEIAEKDGTRGAHVSRLLNATDGIVGATSNLLILLSTNAPPSSLDKALMRPGRCLASIEFAPFSAIEASERLGRTVETPKTLAEIYQELGATSKVNSAGPAPSTGQYL